MAPMMAEPLLVLLFVAIVAAVFLWVRRGSAAQDAEARLLRVCRGNRDQAERLIDSEQRRAPGIARREAAARALQRYERDNR